jgi:hypothetical protein
MKNSLVASFAPEVVSQLRNYSKLMRIDKPVANIVGVVARRRGHTEPGFVCCVRAWRFCHAIRGLRSQRFR